MPPAAAPDPRAELAEFERFFHAALHDLKAPLRAVEHLSQWIEQDLGGGLTPASAENFALLHERVRWMGELLASLQAYLQAAPEDGAAVTVDLAALLAEIRPRLPQRPGIQLRVPAELPAFPAHKAPLGRILEVLLDNAIRHHDRTEGQVELTLRVDGARSTLTVRDDGPGIDARHRPQVFQPFPAIKSREDGRGSGLGLALAAKLARLHGAALRLEAGEGRGCAFSLDWPRA